MPEPTPPASRLELLARWLFVGIPLGWGVWETARTSLALFR